MTRSARFLLLLAALLAATSVGARTRNVTDPDAPRQLPDAGPVSVQWTDPGEFTDLRYSGNRWRASQGNWVYQLAEHLRESASRRIPQGDRLEVTITDVHRAGRYEPWQGVHLQDVRILRDHYPPSMKLEFRHYDAAGQLVAEGSREVRDAGFLMGGQQTGSRDLLYYEKRMIDGWLREELPQRQVAGR